MNPYSTLQSQIHFDKNPERVKAPLAPVELPTVPEAIINSTILSHDFSKINDYKILRRPPSPPLQELDSSKPNVELPAPISSVLVPPRPNTKRNAPRAMDKGELSDEEHAANNNSLQRSRSQKSSPLPPEHPEEPMPLRSPPITLRRDKVAPNALVSSSSLPSSPPPMPRTAPVSAGAMRSKSTRNKPPPMSKPLVNLENMPLVTSPIASPRSGDERDRTPPSFGATLIQLDDNVKFEKGTLLGKGASPGRSRSDSRGEAGHLRSDGQSHTRTDNQGLYRSESRGESLRQNGGGNTLIHLEGEVKFAKGSLLAKGSASNISGPMARSRSRDGEIAQLGFDTPRAAPPPPPLARKDSMPFIRGEPANPPPPLPVNNPTLTTTQRSLLQLDSTREQSHTQGLVDRQMKPLLMFGREVDPAVAERQRQEEIAKRLRDARELKKPLLAFDEFDKGQSKSAAVLTVDDGEGKKKTVVGAEWRGVIG